MGHIRKPLEKGYSEPPGLHAVLTTCLRFSSFLDGACVACCLLLPGNVCHVFMVLGPVLQHIVTSANFAVIKEMHFFMPNPLVQAPSFNATICQ